MYIYICMHVLKPHNISQYPQGRISSQESQRPAMSDFRAVAAMKDRKCPTRNHPRSKVPANHCQKSSRRSSKEVRSLWPLKSHLHQFGAREVSWALMAQTKRTWAKGRKKQRFLKLNCGSSEQMPSCYLIFDLTDLVLRYLASDLSEIVWIYNFT